MLIDLHIQNYALIKDVHINFSSGFNVLTGETGAGKSILVGALGLLLGDKGDPSSIRTGCEEAVVVASVAIDEANEGILWLQERGIPLEEGAVLLKRIIRRSGRGVSSVQGQPVTIKELQEFSSLTFDMHSQHQHQSLFFIENHRKLVDRYGALGDLAAQVKENYYGVTQLKEKYEELLKEESQKEQKLLDRKRDLAEIETAALEELEEERLRDERKILIQGEDLFKAIDNVINLSRSSDSSIFGLDKALAEFQKIESIDENQSEKLSRLQNAYYEIEDVLEGLKDYKRNLDFRPERLEEVESRIALIRGLQKKFGPSFNDVLIYKKECEEYILSIEDYDGYKNKLFGQVQEAEGLLRKLATDLSQKRRDVAQSLEKRITENLMDLGMPKVNFSIDISTREASGGKALCGPSGFDRVEFKISPNLGEPLKPLRDIASGGEISRIMLALKTVLADSDQIASLIFDEIDTGVGGEVALSLGRHMTQLGKKKQVLSITHLASIASFADNHIKIEKVEDSDHTYTKVRVLNADERVEEVSRMLSGDKIDETSRKHAKEMISRHKGLKGAV